MYDQVGFGLTGFSSYHDRFDINSQYFDEYYSKIDSGELPITRGCRRSREEQIRQAIILPPEKPLRYQVGFPQKKRCEL